MTKLYLMLNNMPNYEQLSNIIKLNLHKRESCLISTNIKLKEQFGPFFKSKICGYKIY